MDLIASLEQSSIPNAARRKQESTLLAVFFFFFWHVDSQLVKSTIHSQQLVFIPCVQAPHFLDIRIQLVWRFSKRSNESSIHQLQQPLAR